MYWILHKIHAPLNWGGFACNETLFNRSSDFLEYFLPLSFLKQCRLLPVHPWMCCACRVSRLWSSMETPAPVRHSMGGWRGGFQELSCLTPLPLRCLSSKYSQAHCKYTYFLPTWPCGCIQLLPVSGPRHSSSVKASFTFFCLCDTHWHACTRDERTQMGTSSGWILHGLWRYLKFRALGFEGISAMSGRRSCDPLLWRASVGCTTHTPYEYFDPTHNCLPVFTNIQIHMHYIQI